MTSDRGFSLIELLIVVSIILIIASIAVPNLLRARMSANEVSAANSIRAINTAQVMYQSAYPSVGYADVLSKLGPTPDNCRAVSQAAACLIDVSLSSATSAATAKSGYYFAIGVDSASSGKALQYTVGGTAAAFGKTGARDFCSTEAGVIHAQYPRSQSIPQTSSEVCSGWAALE